MGDPTLMHRGGLRALCRPTRPVLAAALLTVLMTGCITAYGNLKKMLREPGEKLKDFPEVVWNEYDCDHRRLPFVRVEADEVVPTRVRAGSEFNHRMVYSLCPPNPTQVVGGTLDTRILFEGRAIVKEVDPGFELKPGRWVVDTFIAVPEQAEIGIYSLEVVFRGAKTRFRRNLTFAVDRSEATSESTRTRTESP